MKYETLKEIQTLEILQYISKEFIGTLTKREERERKRNV